jgi:hypothetical protein
MKLEFIDSFSKNTQISDFLKILPVGAELFHAERFGGHDEANNPYSQFYERAKDSDTGIALLDKKPKPLVFKIGFWGRNDLLDSWIR